MDLQCDVNIPDPAKIPFWWFMLNKILWKAAEPRPEKGPEIKTTTKALPLGFKRIVSGIFLVYYKNPNKISVGVRGSAEWKWALWSWESFFKMQPLACDDSRHRNTWAKCSGKMKIYQSRFFGDVKSEWLFPPLEHGQGGHAESTRGEKKKSHFSFFYLLVGENCFSNVIIYTTEGRNEFLISGL